MKDPTLYSEASLTAAVAAGDESAFKQLYERYADTIYGVAFAYIKSSAFAEEVVQEVFLKVWIKRESLTQLDKFNSYLFIMARNEVLNQLKKIAKEKKHLDRLVQFFSANTITPEQELLFKESQKLMEDAMDRLPKQQKTVYQMVRTQGLKLEEVAQQLGLSRNTVKNHLGLATQFVRGYVQQHSDGMLLLLALLLLEV